MLDVLLVRLPLGVSPILDTGELLEVHKAFLMDFVEPLCEGPCTLILCFLRRLLVATTFAAIAFVRDYAHPG